MRTIYRLEESPIRNPEHREYLDEQMSRVLDAALRELVIPTLAVETIAPHVSVYVDKANRNWPIKSARVAAFWSLDELRAAAAMRLPLDPKPAMASVRMISKAHENEVALWDGVMPIVRLTIVQSVRFEWFPAVFGNTQSGYGVEVCGQSRFAIVPLPPA